MHTEGMTWARTTSATRDPHPRRRSSTPNTRATRLRMLIPKASPCFSLPVRTVIIFFFFCYGMARSSTIVGQQDGKATKLDHRSGAGPPARAATSPATRRSSRSSWPDRQHLPEPRLDIDDGNQATADLHAREDLLLNYYSKVDGQPGTIRIPIDRAMELIAQRGLPVESQPANAATPVAYANQPVVQAPLTTDSRAPVLNSP